MARYVTEDTEFKGCPMQEGDKVLMAFPAGNHDPELFEDAARFIIDRAKNRHFAFGSAIHRCLGSNLARMAIPIGRAPCRERVFQYVEISVVAVSLKKKKRLYIVSINDCIERINKK